MPGISGTNAGMNPPLGRRLRAGIAGGGPNSFIGRKHIEALRLTLRADLVCGAFSDIPEDAPVAAAMYGVDLERSYPTFEAMMEKESSREDHPDFLIIATPNKFHAQMALAAMEAGWHVYCEKPMCMNVEEADALVAEAEARRTVFAVAHNYVGYPMTVLARDMIARGDLGRILCADAAYLQDWLANPRIEFDPTIPGHYQAKWRVNPAVAGVSCCFGDIGTHAMDMLSFLLDTPPRKLSAKLRAIPDTRLLDTHGEASVQFGDVLAHIKASQVAAGYENELTVRVLGTQGSIEWNQEEPNKLWFRPLGKPRQVLTPRGGAYNSPDQDAACPWPPGHPAGLTNAWSFLYSRFMNDVVTALTSKDDWPKPVYRNQEAGIEEMRFLEAAVESSKEGGAWKDL